MDTTFEFKKGDSTEQVPTDFTLDELWLLRAVVRHETGQPWVGAWPNTSLDLNERIAFGILFLEDTKQDRVCIPLSKGDCLALDSTVPQDAKNANGMAIGKSILMKSFKARKIIADDVVEVGSEMGYNPSKESLLSKLEEWKKEQDASPEPNNNPNDSPINDS